MLFSSVLSEDDALRALEGAVQRTFRAGFRELEAGEEISSGDALVVPVPGGIALRIDEHPDDFEGLVRRLSRSWKPTASTVRSRCTSRRLLQWLKYRNGSICSSAACG